MTLTELFTNIANAIRTKKGTSDKILASDFATEIENLPSGGTEKVLINDASNLCSKRNELIEKLNEYFDFSQCSIFNNMFYSCKLIQSIPLLDTNNGTSFSFMFRYCESLKTIPSMNTSNGTGFDYMFAECKSLETIPLINTSNGTNFNGMFDNCKSLKTIPLIDTGNGTNMEYMFRGCTSLKTIPSIDTSNNTNFNTFFSNCTSLETIPILNASKSNNFYGAFNNCKLLKNFEGLLEIGKAYTKKGNNYSDYSFDLHYSTSITYESLINIINNLYDLNLTYNVANGGTLYTQKLILGSTNTAKLTAEEIAIATAKRMVC